MKLHRMPLSHGICVRARDSLPSLALTSTANVSLLEPPSLLPSPWGLTLGPTIVNALIPDLGLSVEKAWVRPLCSRHWPELVAQMPFTRLVKLFTFL